VRSSYCFRRRYFDLFRCGRRFDFDEVAAFAPRVDFLAVDFEVEFNILLGRFAAVPAPDVDFFLETLERIFSTTFLIGLFPLADELPTSAPATPAATAVTGPPISPPRTAPVMPPAVCFETDGRFASFFCFLAMSGYSSIFRGKGFQSLDLSQAELLERAI